MTKQAPVTTAARRIAREANTRRAGFRLYFDADGHQVAEVFGPEGHGPKTGTYAYAVVTTGDRLTWRGAQDVIDAARERAETETWAAENADLLDYMDAAEDAAAGCRH